jgi:predicted nucleic acid-binding protein
LERHPPAVDDKPPASRNDRLGHPRDSELMRPVPHQTVLAWAAEQTHASLFTTTINQAENLYGIAAVSLGRRRRTLAEAAVTMFAEDFAGHVLSREANAAQHYAVIVATRRKSGNPIEAFDALIAAMARAAGAQVATRDASDFAECGLTVIDPWQRIATRRSRAKGASDC